VDRSYCGALAGPNSTSATAMAEVAGSILRRSDRLQRQCCLLLLLLMSLLQGSDAFIASDRGLRNAGILLATRRLPVLFSKKDDKESKEVFDRRSLYEKEEESSKKVFNNLTAGNGLGTVVTGAGWAFVVIGFILNMFGYDYVVRDGRVTIDTVEARQFQMEVNKSMKVQKKLETSSSPRNAISNDLIL
jgi:hypothetical protein